MQGYRNLRPDPELLLLVRYGGVAWIVQHTPVVSETQILPATSSLDVDSSDLT